MEKQRDVDCCISSHLGAVSPFLILFTGARALLTRRYAPFNALIHQQFSEVRPLLSSSSALHLLYASGRRNVLALHATLRLYPLHDILYMVWKFANSLLDPTYDNSEGIELDLTLGRGASGQQDGVGVWGIVDKGVMKRIREQRFDMVSRDKTSVVASQC